MQWRGRDLAVDPGKVSTSNLAFSCQFRIRKKRERRTRQSNIYSIFTHVSIKFWILAQLSQNI